MITNNKYTLKRKNRLKSKTTIDQLFVNGKTIIAYPLRLVYINNTNAEKEIKVGFSVPKKKFKNAVDRNKIKRLMRESYRKQQYNIIKPQNLSMMWLYLSNEIPSLKHLEKNMKIIIDQLNQKMEQ